MSGKSHDCECDESNCGVCNPPHYERNRYFRGKTITVRDLRAEQLYFQQKRWLVNRMIHGCGVVCGLAVDGVAVDGLSVTGEAPNSIASFKASFRLGRGMALDGLGREIVVCDDDARSVAYAGPGDDLGAKASADKAHEYVLCLEYDACDIEPVEVPRGECDEEATAYNRVRDSHRLVWRRIDSSSPDTPGRCACPLDHLTPRECGKEPVQSVHDYLCEHTQKSCDGCPSCRCVVLGTLRLSYGRGAEPAGNDEAIVAARVGGGAAGWRWEFDRCRRRRLVYTNPLLYQLIDCYHGDLPRIVSINWAEWEAQPPADPTSPKRRVPWDAFYAHFVGDGWSGTIKEPKPGTGFRVCFDREMDPESLNDMTFLVRVTMREDQGRGYLVQRQVPGHVEVDDNGRRATFQPDWRWVIDEIVNENSELGGLFVVEVVLRSALILDRRGKALDGDPIRFERGGVGFRPTGNGSQGGDFVSHFHVDRQPSARSTERNPYEFRRSS